MSLPQTNVVPLEFAKDRHWKGTLYIFLNHHKLSKYFSTHIDENNCSINVTGLKKISKSWSPSEKFMLNLALHLHSKVNKIDLSDMDLLDERNKRIALEAIKLRFDVQDTKK